MASHFVSLGMDSIALNDVSFKHDQFRAVTDKIEKIS